MPEPKDYSAAPNGSLRNRLEQNRQGASAYGPLVEELAKVVALNPEIIQRAFENPSVGTVAPAALEVASLVPAVKGVKGAKLAKAARTTRQGNTARDALASMAFPSGRAAPMQMAQGYAASQDTQGQANAQEWAQDPAGVSEQRFRDSGSAIASALTRLFGGR